MRNELVKASAVNLPAAGGGTVLPGLTAEDFGQGEREEGHPRCPSSVSLNRH
jgi:hypothetical protein